MATTNSVEVPIQKIFTISDHVEGPSTSGTLNLYNSRDLAPSSSRRASELAVPLERIHVDTDSSQFTICVGVQTDISEMNSIFGSLSGTGISPPEMNPISPRNVTNDQIPNSAIQNGRWQRIKRNLDCTTFCYLAIAALMIGVGTLVTAVTARDKILSDDSSGSAQLWIVGPIFISSGILVCIKAATHMCKRVNQTATAQEGNFLSPDSRASLRAIPPSYSKALVAPVPSCVVEIEDFGEDKFSELPHSSDTDHESHRLVSIQCDPPPPTYDEAIEVIRRNSTSEVRKHNVRDVATQIGSEPTQTDSVERRVRNAFSENDVAQSASPNDT